MGLRAGQLELPRNRRACAARVVSRRRELGLSQQQLADRMTGPAGRYTNRAISRMENGQAILADELPALAAALDCSVTYLLGLTDDAAAWTPVAPARPARSRQPAGRAEISRDPSAAPAAALGRGDLPPILGPGLLPAGRR